MKILTKVFSFSLLVSTLLYLFSGVNLSEPKNGKNSALTFLTVGFDDSPSNTDVLGVATYDSIQNTVRFVQIPRDTAVHLDTGVCKINSFYSRKILEGKTDGEAIEELKQFVSSLLGIQIDGCIALTTKGFVDVIDYLGGITLNTSLLPQSLIKEMDLGREKTHFDAQEILSLIRYRKGYARGDLERLDTQKIVFRAIAAKIGKKRDKFSLLKFLRNNDGVFFSVNKGRFFSFAFENIFKIENSDFQIATIPGLAKESDNTWYYFIDKSRADALIRGYFPYSFNEFDAYDKFVYSL